MLTHLRHLVFGSPLPSADLGETRLDKVRALAALSPDALASVAYANQEIYLGLLVAGAVGLGHAFSYRQTCWEAAGMDRVARLITVPSPYRSLIGPFLDCVERLDEESADGWPVTVLIPEFVPARWWHFLLHNQTALPLKWALVYRRHRHGKSRAVIDVPFYLRG